MGHVCTRGTPTQFIRLGKAAAAWRWEGRGGKEGERVDRGGVKLK